MELVKQMYAARAAFLALSALALPGGTRPLAAQLPADTTEEALVLSGGGSRGLAHAGVFVGLERLGHDPDLVVGTSMGAVVGALYAAGYPPEEIQRQIREVDWGATFTPAPLLLGPDRVARYPLATFDRDVDPLRFNRGLIPQWRINRALVHLLFDANARSRGDFDRLARRYRAVATDLKTGDTVVIGGGDLARAARASLAVPGVFAPVEWEDRSLVDGGIASNLPTGVARELGAERVIAVDVSRASPEIEGRAPLQVASRALDLLQDNVQNDTVPPDVLVLPRIPPSFYGVTFPGDPTPLFAIGLEAALRDVRPVPGERPAARRLPPAPERLGALLVEAPDPAIEALVRRVFTDVVPGPYSPGAVLKAVDRLYTTGLFEGIWPRVEDTLGISAPALVVRLESPPAISVAGGAGYDTDRGGRAWGAVQRTVAWGRAPVLLTGALFLDALEQWGSASARAFSLRFFPLVWSTGVYLREADVRRFGEETLLEDVEVRRMGGWAGIEFQQLLAQRVMSAVVRVERLGVEDGESGLSMGPHLRLSAPEPEVPVVGVPLEVEGEWRWGTFAYRRASARGSLRRAFGKLRVAGVGDAAIASTGAPPDVLPALGDRHAVPGFRWGQERGRARVVTGVDAAYPLPTGGYGRGRLRAGVAADGLEGFGASGSWVTGAELGAFWSTPFGALRAAWGINTRGETRAILSLGPEF
jgi:predicted acylesterase/phospholipase RssA